MSVARSIFLPVTDAATINAVAGKPVRMQIAAEYAVIPIVYGTRQVAARIVNVLPYGNNWVVQVMWCEGEIDAVSSYTFNDQAPVGTATHYTGTAGQGVDPTLAAAFTANGIAYSDTLPNVAYSVIVFPQSFAGMPNIKATIRGRKLYDPRSGLTQYSECPALALRDFVTNTRYGEGMTIADSTVITVADANDATVSGKPRRTINVELATQQAATAIRDTLATYAGAWAIREGTGVYLVANRPASPVMTFAHASGQIRALSGLKRRGIANLPNAVEVRYTDTSQTPWRDASQWAYSAGVMAGTSPRRESQVALPGITNASQAYREAVERLNQLTLADLACSLDVFDEALQLMPGDVVSVTHPIGLTAKQFRVQRIDSDNGRHRLDLLEYDPAVYSDAVASDPTTPDTSLPDPTAPPALLGLTATQDVYQLETGLYAGRIRLTWLAPGAAFPYPIRYSVQVTQAGQLIDARSVDSPAYTSPPIKEGVEYVCTVAIVSSVGAVGTAAQVNVMGGGKTGNYIPSNVTGVTCFEAGGRVYVSWAASVDTDLWRYEVRYWAGGGSWDSGTVIDRVDALRLWSDQLPVGTWTIGVKALDSVGQYSPTAATASVTVTTDANSFFIGTKDQTSPTLTNMAAYTLARTDANAYYVTEDGATVASKFTAALTSYGNVMATYHASVTSTWLGESEDFGTLVAGNWSGTATVSAISGSLTSYLGLSSDGSGWTYYAGLAQKQNGRFARLKHEGLTTSTIKVTVPTESIRVDVVPKAPESFSNQLSLSSGGKRIQLVGKYVSAVSIGVVPLGSAQRSYSIDDVLVGPETGLQFQCTVTGGGNCYSYRRISTSARVILASDYLEYEVFIVRQPGSALVGGFDIDFSDATHARNFSPSDAYGGIHIPTIASGVWASRKLALSAMAGKTSASFDLVTEVDTAGEMCAIYRNIKITDGAGTTRLSIYGTTGEPPANADAYSALVSSVKCGPSNSFMVYLFSGASQVADYFNATFAGV